MLIKLGGRGVRALGQVSSQPFIGRISTQLDRPGDSEIWLAPSSDTEPPPGFRAYLLPAPPAGIPALRDSYVLGAEFAYLRDGDVVRLEPERSAIHALYRRNSRSNSLLVTERCNNYCVMCSQPPKARDDSWIINDLMQAIPLMSPETTEIGITGGEPSLLGPRPSSIRSTPGSSVSSISST
jgi:hypothetical protein